MILTKTILAVYAETSKHWHLACNYDRINPNLSSVEWSEGNPHKRNYQKAMEKLKEVTQDLPIEEL